MYMYEVWMHYENVYCFVPIPVWPFRIHLVSHLKITIGSCKECNLDRSLSEKAGNIVLL